MTLPSWWQQRRYGLFVHATIATVPAFSPIGEYAEWYWSHLEGGRADVLLHPQPMPEVQAWHAERYPDVRRFDDFWPLLSFDRFDADAWAELAVAGGMGYLVHVTKHHDGLCWWDSPLTDRTSMRKGPGRDVVAEVSGACERAGLVFGTYYSLLDWGHPDYPRHDRYVSQFLHPQVLDLVERYGSRVLWGDGHWGHGPQHWRSEELVARCRTLQPDLVVNDRWWVADEDIVATHEYDVPALVPRGPWELCRGVGASFGFNRSERAEHHLDAGGLVRLLTEVVAKGGNLLLSVGPMADGTVPDRQSTPIREVGRWLAAHPGVIDGSRPFPGGWGDGWSRLTLTPGASGRPDRVNAVDVAGRPQAVFGPLRTGQFRVERVETTDGAPVRWEATAEGLAIDRPDRPVELGIPVYHVWGEVVAPASRRATVTTTIPPVASLLDAAAPGDVVELPPGHFAGPLTVPAAVTVRAASPGATTIDGRGEVAVRLTGDGARVHGLVVTGGPDRLAFFPAPAVTADGVAGVVVSGCRIDGAVSFQGCRDARVERSELANVQANGCEAVSVLECTARGMRWDVGIEIVGGADHVVAGNELADHLCAVRVREVRDTRVEWNRVRARWWGIHVDHGERVLAAANSVSGTMRGLTATGGHDVHLHDNEVADGDTGALVERHATATVVGNRIDGCRVGILAWESPDARLGINEITASHHHDTVVGP